jgi:ABC-2 type transport system ATP-binding protein
MDRIDALLVAEGLRRSFGTRVAVDGIGFHIDPGETYGLLGPNGSGKTTTISMIAGILRPDAGTVTVAGRALTTAASEVKAAIGLVPQDVALYDDLSAVENLRFFGRLQGLSGRTLANRIDAVLDVVGLAERGRDRIEEYSGGMKRRANIAAGLLHQPRLLILDEPTVGVDPQSRNQILESIETLGGEGLAVLYTTHYMEEAERLCQRIGILDQGRLIAEGTRRELVASIGEHDVIGIVLGPDGLDSLDAAAGAGGGGGRRAFVQQCRALPGVADLRIADGRVEVAVDRADRVLPGVIGAASASGVPVTAVTVTEPNLEAVFLRLTGRALRD